MADSAKRFLNILKKTNVDTVSDLVCLTATSTDPLLLQADERLILTSDFVVFDNYIDVSKITVGDKFRAISLSGNQIYYIIDIVYSDKELDKYIQRIERLENRFYT